MQYFYEMFSCLSQILIESLKTSNETSHLSSESRVHLSCKQTRAD